MPVSQSRRARAARRRTRRVAAADNDLTRDEWEAIVEAWGACAYCGVGDGPFQRDCVLPISRGGRYTFENVVPACRSCNASKCNDEVTGWLRRKRLDERAFLLRHVEILAAWRMAAVAAPAEGASVPTLPPTA
jgi:5-methylcytosine-specific restriction endonuclease McrA